MYAKYRGILQLCILKLYMPYFSVQQTAQFSQLCKVSLCYGIFSSVIKIILLWQQWIVKTTSINAFF